MIVVDTNIVAYLLLDNEHTQASREVFKCDNQWSAPLLWRSEFCNVLTLHMRHKRLSLAAVSELMEEAQKLFVGQEFQVSSTQVLYLTKNLPVSAYDAEFICLAQNLGVPLITTDKRILSSAPDLAYSPEAFLKSN